MTSLRIKEEDMISQTTDDRFSKNLLLRIAQDHVKTVGKSAPSLPEPQPMSDEQEQFLGQMADVIRFIGDDLDQNPKFNKMVDGFARVVDRQSFQKLVDKVFVDGITWGKIVTLICVVGKSFAKILANLISGIVSWTLDYFSNRLLNWICNRGGWINSLSSLANFSFEQDFGSTTSLISPSSVFLFISGLLLGGLIVWRVNRSV